MLSFAPPLRGLATLLRMFLAIMLSIGDIHGGLPGLVMLFPRMGAEETHTPHLMRASNHMTACFVMQLV